VCVEEEEEEEEEEEWMVDMCRLGPASSPSVGTPPALLALERDVGMTHTVVPREGVGSAERYVGAQVAADQILLAWGADEAGSGAVLAGHFAITTPHPYATGVAANRVLSQPACCGGLSSPCTPTGHPGAQPLGL